MSTKIAGGRCANTFVKGELAMREKLIDIVEAYADFLDWDTKEDMVDSIMEKCFATDNNVGSKWIPVTERLPENDQWVLCFMKDKAFGTFRVFQWNYIDWQWNDGNEWYDEKDVTHWMPLPEPPKRRG